MRLALLRLRPRMPGWRSMIPQARQGLARWELVNHRAGLGCCALGWGGGISSGCVAARCQRAAIPKIPRIGVLWHAGNEEEEALYLGALRKVSVNLVTWKVRTLSSKIASPQNSTSALTRERQNSSKPTWTF